MSSRSRSGMVLIGGGILTALALLPSAWAEQTTPVVVSKPPPGAAKNPTPFEGSEAGILAGRQVSGFVSPPGVLKPSPFKAATQPADIPAASKPADVTITKLLAVADAAIQERRWADAIRILQALLDAPEDALGQFGRQGSEDKEISLWISPRAEAHRRIGRLPPRGMEVYRTVCDPLAQKLLQEARSRNDRQLLAEVVARYFYTPAGSEALRLLGSALLDWQESLRAALCFERMLDRTGAAQQSPETLFRAALAFRRSGNTARTEQVWKQLSARVGKGDLRIGGRELSLEQWRKELQGAPSPVRENAWPLFRGDASRSARGNGGAPVLEARWTVSTLPQDDPQKWVKNTILDRTISYLEQRGQPVLPGSFPVMAGGSVLYRTADGVRSVRWKDGLLNWSSRCDGGLWEMGYDKSRRDYLTIHTQWFSTYHNSGPQSIFFDNSVIGTLSTDGRRVYAVDDLAVPPPSELLQSRGFAQQRLDHLGPFREIANNKLRGIKLESGKLMWELGDEREEKNKDFKDCFFLGPPLPLNGQLFVLNEKAGSLRLMCLHPVNGTLIWLRALAKIRDQLPFDVGRRIYASHLAYSDGILVCPTNAGAVLGFDLLTRSVIWAHAYREADPAPRPQPQPPVPINPFGQLVRGSLLHAAWKTAAPAIQDDKVVFTALDATSVHCLNLHDGRLLWKDKRQDDDLYLAGVFNGKVVIVGKSYCRAVQLADGKPSWKVATGLPSGQGTASDNVYYLPLQATIDTKEPAVYAIDLDKGVIRARIVSRKKEVPGNLIFYGGAMLSQTVTAVTAYPLLKAKLEEK